MDDRKTSWCRQRLNDSCVRRCLCCPPCKLQREERLFARARTQLQKELDIVAFVRKIRRMDAICDQARKSLDTTKIDSG